MLKIKCINPTIMKALSLCGHGDKILIADGNYPLDSKTNCHNKVYLGLCDDVPTVTQVLEVLKETINIEHAQVMKPDSGKAPVIYNEFSEILAISSLEKLERFEFYDECCKENVKLAISTGEKRIFANILITIGVA